MKKPELLSPAGDWPSLKAAIEAGADAVYFGLKSLNMRESATNFSIADLKKAIDLCHSNKVKAYLTLNTIIFDNEIKKIERYVKEAKRAKIDAVICWDFSVLLLCKKHKVPIILSTQASVSNIKSAKFYKNLGIKRIVLARELNLNQIKNIIKKVNIEIEIFIHGALCYSISGRCFFSQELYKKSANRGECFQPCRRTYKLIDLKTNKEIEARTNQFLSTKDLCALPFIDKLIELGIHSFKIEGRNRSPEYVYATTRVYRQAIDSYFDKTLKQKLPALQKELEKVYNRKFSSGFYISLPTSNDITKIQNSAAIEKRQNLGIVTNYFKKKNVAVIRLRSASLSLGDDILIIGNKTGMVNWKVDSMEVEYKQVKDVKKGQLVGVYINHELRRGDKVYKIIKQE